MNLKTGMSASLFLHCLLIIPMMLAAVTVETEQGKLPATEIEVIDKGQEKENRRLIPLGEGGQDKIRTDRFYYGIGVGIDEYYSQRHEKNVKVITAVTSGYSAEAAGIIVKDTVLQVNGKDLGKNNDITGSSPGRISLTIFRNETIIIIQLDRVKVYY